MRMARGSRWRGWLTPRPLIALLALLSLAACSISPIGQADAPTPPAVQLPTADEAAPSDAPAATPRAGGVALAGQGPELITGTFAYTNDIITTYYVEHMVALVDMYGFVKRDKEWDIPVDSQVLGFMKIDQKAQRGEYHLQLPAQPLGQPVDVDHNGRKDAGVQVFVTAYWPNLIGGPYSEGDDRSVGWPSYLASTVNDTENEDEVIGGKLIVWAPDAQQQFPTGFGADGKLFTDDDPVGPIPAGYSAVDLDQQPFALSQAAQQDLALHEPNDVTIKDYSKLSYSEAFKQLVDKLRVEYAFNDVAGKAPNWDELYGQFAPRVAEAEQRRDPQALALAIHEFTLQFHDGHVGGDIPNLSDLFREKAGGGYGFAGRLIDDGRFIVTFVLKGGPAEQAGMAIGAEITQFDGKPIAEAVAAVRPFEGPYSTDFGLRTAQERYLVRAPVGTAASVTFATPGRAPATARLKAVEEYQSYFASIPPRSDDPAALPVQARVLASGLGYIKVSSNSDDLGLIMRLFERALKTFETNQVAGVIIDMRENYGGSPLKLAGFLTNKVIPLGQLEYYSDKTGKFEPEGPPEKVEPYEEQYTFDKLALLVDQYCYSACEIEAYGFSQVQGMVVVGQLPTAGVEAEVARGEFKLPEDISLQFPTGRFKLPDGSLFLEGQGVKPTLRVPLDQKTVLSKDDVVLQAAEQALGR